MKCKCGKTMTRGESDAAGICTECYCDATDEKPYQICAEPECGDNTEGNRPFCDEHTEVHQQRIEQARRLRKEAQEVDIDGAQMAHDEMEEPKGE